MPYGPTVIAELVTTDMVAPSMPTFVLIEQTDNVTMRAVCSIPTSDVGGGALTGITKLTVATAPMSGGVNPFDGLSMEEILALPEAASVDVALVEADAGTQKEVTLPVVNLGGYQAFAAACSDE